MECKGCSEPCVVLCSSQADCNKLDIELLYIDIDTCDRCQGSDRALAEAIAELQPILLSLGWKIECKKILIENEAQAELLHFSSSPTIRIDGCDIQPHGNETNCTACGDLCGDEIDCRIWQWRGQQYTEPPKEMLIDAILRSIYQPKQSESQECYQLPKNLKRFFAGKTK